MALKSGKFHQGGGVHVSSSPLDARASASVYVSPHIRPSISPQSGGSYGGAGYHGAISGMPRGDLPRGVGGGGGGEGEVFCHSGVDGMESAACDRGRSHAARGPGEGSWAKENVELRELMHLSSKPVVGFSTLKGLGLFAHIERCAGGN
jgi:hypothetical protein